MNIFDIPIITYHKISTEKEFGITTITPNKFKSQMQLLADNGYQTVTFKQFLTQQNIPEKSIIISFDDTYKSVYVNAFPIMKQLNFKGILFVISDYISNKNLWEAYPIQRKHDHASIAEIKEILKDGFELGSHTLTHPYLPYLDNGKLKQEIIESKNKLENIFKTEIISFCYPYGGSNLNIMSELKSVRYLFATTNIKLGGQIRNNALCLIRRSIYSTDSLNTFYNKVKTPHKINFNYFCEWIIQIGAYAGIIKKRLSKI